METSPWTISIFISRTDYPLPNWVAFRRAEILVDVLVRHLFECSGSSLQLKEVANLHGGAKEMVARTYKESRITNRLSGHRKYEPLRRLFIHFVTFLTSIFRYHEVQIHGDSNLGLRDSANLILFSLKISWQGLSRPTMSKDRFVVKLPGASCVPLTFLLEFFNSST